MKKNQTARPITDRNSVIPIGIMDFRSEIHKSDQFFFKKFNYEKVPIKNPNFTIESLIPKPNFLKHTIKSLKPKLNF